LGGLLIFMHAKCSQETEKFAKAFKDPEFIRLFEEYAKEVSDPKVQSGL